MEITRQITGVGGVREGHAVGVKEMVASAEDDMLNNRRLNLQSIASIWMGRRCIKRMISRSSAAIGQRFWDGRCTAVHLGMG